MHDTTCGFMKYQLLEMYCLNVYKLAKTQSDLPSLRLNLAYSLLSNTRYGILIQEMLGFPEILSFLLGIFIKVCPGYYTETWS